MQKKLCAFLLSRPVWGAWVEIRPWWRRIAATRSRPVWGAWVEIKKPAKKGGKWYSRAPYGARGLKKAGVNVQVSQIQSRPVWGAWVEISSANSISKLEMVAPRMGRVG